MKEIYIKLLKMFIREFPTVLPLDVPSRKQDRYVIATDGHGMVIIEDKEFAEDYEEVENYPNVFLVVPEENRKDRIARLQLETAFAKLPTEDELKDGEKIECTTCDGRGSIECFHCGNDAECEECDGTGEIREKVKTGNKFILPTTKLEINGVWFMYEQMKRLYDAMVLLNIEYIEHLSGGGLNANLMKSGNVSFTIMPIR